MITPISKFEMYKQFAYDAFKFLAPKITQFHKNVKLSVDYADYITHTYANLRRPSWVYLHLYNLMCNCHSSNSLTSMIVIALTHELFHSEQVIIQERYNSDCRYKQWIEASTNKAAYDFLVEYRQQIQDELTDLSLEYFMSSTTEMSAGYTRCNLEEYYHLLFLNVIVRSMSSYKKIAETVLNAYPTILITFDRINNFLIKSNGEYCRNTLPAFIRAIEYYVARYDYYTMSVRLDESFNRDHPQQALMIVEKFNGGIHPMAFSTMS